MVTMRDVARQAGVSSATVSHVLNGTRKVNADTASAVREALQVTGYVNDSVARAMRTGTTRTIGLALSAISNPYFGDVVHSIEELLTARDYSLLLADTHDVPDAERRAIDDLLQHRPAGIVLAPSESPGETLRVLAARKVPVVCIDRVVPGVDSVGVESGEATRTMVRHLIGIGHRRIAMVCGRAGLTTSDDRVAGYRAGMADGGLEVTPDLLLLGDSRGPVARPAVAAALARQDRPTALMVGNNQMTIGTMQALRDAGLRVPEDIALAAFDDFEWSDLFSPRLTAISQPVGQMATIAVEMLLERMADQQRPARNVRLEPELHHRDSCGCGDPAATLAW